MTTEKTEKKVVTFEEKLEAQIVDLKQSLDQHQANINFTAGSLKATEGLLEEYLKTK
jgi:hypothetical protein